MGVPCQEESFLTYNSCQCLFVSLFLCAWCIVLGSNAIFVVKPASGFATQNLSIHRKNHNFSHKRSQRKPNQHSAILNSHTPTPVEVPAVFQVYAQFGTPQRSSTLQLGFYPGKLVARVTAPRLFTQFGLCDAGGNTGLPPEDRNM